jgi:hypothetical protein
MNGFWIRILGATVSHAAMVGDFAPLQIGNRWTYVGESRSASVDAPGISNFHSQVKRTIAITGMSRGGDTTVYVGIILDSCSEVRLHNVSLGDTVMQKEFVLSEKDNRLSVLSLKTSYGNPTLRAATSFELDPLPLLQHGFQTHTFQDSLGSIVNHSGQIRKWITDSTAITIPPATGLSLVVSESIRCPGTLSTVRSFWKLGPRPDGTAIIFETNQDT